jgi:hypothetical protein
LYQSIIIHKQCDPNNGKGRACGMMASEVERADERRTRNEKGMSHGTHRPAPNAIPEGDTDHRSLFPWPFTVRENADGKENWVTAELLSADRSTDAFRLPPLRAAWTAVSTSRLEAAPACCAKVLPSPHKTRMNPSNLGSGTAGYRMGLLPSACKLSNQRAIWVGKVVAKLAR